MSAAWSESGKATRPVTTKTGPNATAAAAISPPAAET
jgi:hypothetical protein